MGAFEPFVIDRHAFERLWPALGVWLFLFLTAGDATTTLGRLCASRLGVPVDAVVEGRAKRQGRSYLELSYERQGTKHHGRAPIAGRASSIPAGAKRQVYLWAGRAYLADDLGYSRWKLGLFGAAFLALWAWALARRRFG